MHISNSSLCITMVWEEAEVLARILSIGLSSGGDDIPSEERQFASSMIAAIAGCALGESKRTEIFTACRRLMRYRNIDTIMVNETMDDIQEILQDVMND